MAAVPPVHGCPGGVRLCGIIVVVDGGDLCFLFFVACFLFFVACFFVDAIASAALHVGVLPWACTWFDYFLFVRFFWSAALAFRG